jgi:predicted unusual protein kinase regulating ubiquinone biosynthesis (AarF/ABC1/UbiB family)
MDNGDERSTRLGELRRLVRTSSAVGGIAARVLGARAFGIKGDRGAHAEDLKLVLGGLKGPLMKVAQFLATVPDALPAEYAAELAELQANAPPMGWSFVRRRMEGELGSGWEAKFAAFGQTAAAAASLGQVHRARLPDGTEVACKLQYPNMASTIDADLRQLRLAMSVYQRIDGAIQHGEILKELTERLREELDYLREAAQMRLYRQLLATEPLVHVPEPVEGYCTRRLLTMTWLDGTPLLARLQQDPPQEERNRLAEALFKAWYVPLYRYGVLHGDPHMGNYQARPDGSVNLLDFGSIRVFAPKFIRGVIDLYEAMRDGNLEQAHHAYSAWGFGNLNHEQMDVLNEWARFLYEPLLDDRARRIQPNADPNYARAIAMRVHQGLKRTGGVTPPREFVLMDRSAIGLGSVFLRLGAELNWSRMFRELIADYDDAALAARQRAALEQAGVPLPS